MQSAIGIRVGASFHGSTNLVNLGRTAHAEEFSAIRGIRELPDGRLLVSDYIDQRVVLVDLDRGTVVVRVTQGSGGLAE